MKNYTSILLNLMLYAIINLGCSKKEATPTPTPPAEKHFTELNWKVTSVTKDGVQALAPTENNINTNAYILDFISDSIFSLNLSANETEGSYALIDEQHITIFGFIGQTQICCDTDFDENWLVPTMNTITTYKWDGGNLTLTGNNNDKVEFVYAY